MVKHTQTIRRLLADELFENVWPFCGVGAERVNFDTLSSLINYLLIVWDLIVGGSIVKHIDGWRLNKSMRSTISGRSIPGATTKGMIPHVKGCLQDTSPDFVILHYDTNDLNDSSTSEEIAEKILNLATLIKTRKNQVFVSG